MTWDTRRRGGVALAGLNGFGEPQSLAGMNGRQWARPKKGPHRRLPVHGPFARFAWQFGPCVPVGARPIDGARGFGREIAIFRVDSSQPSGRAEQYRPLGRLRRVRAGARTAPRPRREPEVWWRGESQLPFSA
jgi:hypothetical protein